jgi:tagatose-1,6-bisphosphate aldolase non-catalytic subunit AgaZ/GatZ
LTQSLAGRSIPAPLLQQFVPKFAGEQGAGGFASDQILLAVVDDALAGYYAACTPRGS